MSLLCLRSTAIPSSLSGWTITNHQGLPRYWATLWIDVIKGVLSEVTRRAHLAAVDRLYKSMAIYLTPVNPRYSGGR
jgi:hypothetical protein